MNILLISQCSKKALVHTRKTLDTFARRVGERSWQTSITQAGLDTLHTLLKKTARKNTAVACHYTHGSKTSLLWVVGDKSQFDAQGQVPTNRTQRTVLPMEEEHTWVHGYSIQIMSVIGALLHDLGKASYGFQRKLMNSTPQSDPYRHEWVSLQLFQAMIHGCTTDQEWLYRLANWGQYVKKNPEWATLVEHSTKNRNAPPLAQWMMWLIVTHHRLPFYSDISYHSETECRKLQDHVMYNHMSVNDWFTHELQPVAGWQTPGSYSTYVHPNPDWFWTFKPVALDSVVYATDSKQWQKDMARWANKALAHAPLMALATQPQHPCSDPLLTLLSRMCLMVGDHNYSSLKTSSDKRIEGDKDFPLWANTSEDGSLKQRLDEHLCGVGRWAALFGHRLPTLKQHFPSIGPGNRAFQKRTTEPRFTWQNKVYDVCKSLQQVSERDGFFGVNLASTGRGKTLGNARMMYALANPTRGARFTVALTLRVLTLQTGVAYREKLGLSADQLAVAIGDTNVSALFEAQNKNNVAQDNGSESAEDLLEPATVVDGHAFASSLGTLVADKKAAQFITAPIVSCTVDRLMHASECLRGGKYIPAYLRLLTGDLILDEPDDLSQEDLPALSRLVYMAGVLGSRVLLSSATMPPDLVVGLWRAYTTGRAVWAKHHNQEYSAPPCVLCDEFDTRVVACNTKEELHAAHQKFATTRVEKLALQPVRVKAAVLPEVSASHNKDQFFEKLAEQMLETMHSLHHTHAEHHPESNKYISVGLARFANISSVTALSQALTQKEAPDDTRVHICCYHARQLLCLRNQLEYRLDRMMRRTPGKLLEHPDIVGVANTYPEKNHIFVVLSSPICEVGRDHDYDWAIVEPSSVRSLVQLAGRIKRHRPDLIASKPNVFLLASNIRWLRGNKNNKVPSFNMPGPETSKFLLSSHATIDVIANEHLQRIDSTPRIIKPLSLTHTKELAHLEHHVIQQTMNTEKDNFVSSYYHPNYSSRLHVHMQKMSPFRRSRKQEEYVCFVDDDDKFQFKTEPNAWEHPYDNQATCNHLIKYVPVSYEGRVQPWLVGSVKKELQYLQSELALKNPSHTALRFSKVRLPEDMTPPSGWRFNEWLGFW